MGHAASAIVPGLRLALGYADLLLKDIKPADFARWPNGVSANHPAFCYGHLAIYPDRALAMLGRPELAAPDARSEELFAAGKDCRDDPGATIYPPMSEIVERFRDRHQAILAVLADTPDDVFARPNPNEKARERLPTIGGAVGFYFGGHLMSHLGQVSTWRRCMGLGPAMG